MMFSSRLRTIFNQAANSCQSSQNSPCSGTGRIDVNKPTSSADIQPSLKWNGWGYADTEFEIRTPPDLVCVTGSRYENSGKVMPYLVAFMKEKGVPVEDRCDSVSIDNITIPEPIPNFAFLSSFESSIKTDCSSEARIRHSHGHSIQEIYALRTGNPGRVPDSVVYVTSQAEVETVIAAAVKHNAVIIPFGGGTCVSHALICSPTESRHICSLDMSKMNSINWIDFDNMTAEIQAGAVGVNIESVLKEYGLCLGHEPDSHEFSSLGGWIATRASGMKKNAYGNIEDIVVKITLVTPKGVVVNYSEAPRQSVGPDINNIALGSEGNFGIITSAVVRVRSLPEAQEFAALLFPNFENGVKFMHEVARRRIAPASIRLVDNDQFHFGAAVKPASGSWFSNEKLKKWIIAKLGFDINEMSACTLLFEGSKSEIVKQKWNVFAIAWDYGGRYVGSSAGRQGYNLTFLIAYIRDFGLSLGLLGESFESCVPWSNVVELCKRVKDRITTASAKLSVTVPPFTSCRISQTYDCGACVYFYFAIVSKGLKEPISTFSKIEDEAREEILKCGGSLSHHHGIGKIRKHFTKDALSHAAIDAIRAVKTELDPTNVFACGNTL